MAGEEKCRQIQELCSTAQVVRENYYSTTYRCYLQLNSNEASDWDVQHIRIPFTKDKEAAIQKRFGFGRDELNAYYAEFLNEVRNSIMVVEELRKAEHPGIEDCVLFHKARYYAQDPKDGHFDIYIIYPPAEQFLQEGRISELGSTTTMVIQTAYRLLQFTKKINDAGYSIGTIDVDSLLLQQKDDKSMLKLSFLPVAAHSGSIIHATPDFAVHMPAEVTDGKEGVSFDNDLSAIYDLTFTMLAGYHFYCSGAQTNGRLMCSQKLADTLCSVMENFKGSYPVITKAIRQELAEINGNISSSFQIDFQPYPVSEQQETVEELPPQEAEEDTPEPGPDASAPPNRRAFHLTDEQRGRLRKALPIFAATAAMLTIMFLSTKMVGGASDPDETTMPSDSQTTATDGTTQGDTQPATMQRTSQSENLYVDGSRIVNSRRELQYGYYLDTSGAIYFDPSVLPMTLSEVELAGHVIDLSESRYSYANVLNIPKGDMDAYRITEGCFLVFSQWDTAQSYPVVTAITWDADNQNASVSLSPTRWEDLLQNCSSDWYQDLVILSREQEANRILKRDDDVNGETVTLYYDLDGNVYTKEDWEKQEALKVTLEQVKEEIESIQSQGLSEAVPASGVEQFVPIEGIRCKTQYDISLSKDGKVMFVIDLALEPENATCQYVTVAIPSDAKAGIPFQYNARYIAESHSLRESLKTAELDFSIEKKVSLVVNCEGTGNFELSLTPGDGSSEKKISVSVSEYDPSKPSNGGVVEAPSVPAQTTEETTQATEATEAPTETTTPPQPTTPRATEPPATQPPATTAPPTQPPTTQPPTEPEDDIFTVTPGSVTLRVGETCNLSPSMSCTWSSSDSGIASIGGGQGRTVTAKAVGSCIIYARSSDGQTAMVYVTVVE